MSCPEVMTEEDRVGGDQLWLIAMRSAVRLQGNAMAACDRRACRRTGLCHMTVDDSGAADCGARYNRFLADYACETFIDTVAQHARVFRAGQPWSRYDPDLGGASPRKGAEAAAGPYRKSVAVNV